MASASLSSSSIGLLLDAYLRDADSRLRLSAAIETREAELPDEDRNKVKLRSAQEKLLRGAIISMDEEKTLGLELRRIGGQLPNRAVLR